jgi:hypothetical protein
MAPVNICLVLVYLFYTLGLAALPGVLITTILIPVSIYGANFSKRWQVKTEEKKLKI